MTGTVFETDQGLLHRPCGVVVTYHPDDGVIERIAAMSAECDHVVVVDNGSGGTVGGSIAKLPRVTYLPLPENLGIAVALNRGAFWAKERGYTWIVTFDQDSLPQTGMISALLATAARHPQTAVVGPRIVDTVRGRAAYKWVKKSAQWPLLFRRVPCENDDLVAVTSVITSGSLVSLHVWERVNGFDDALFIDYVDNDLCLKVIEDGFLVCVAHDAFLEHRLGERTRHSALGHDFRPTHHSALRHYFMARNRIILWRRYAARHPHWAGFDLLFAGYNYVRVLAFEKERIPKIRAIMLGTWDGLSGRSGPCPENRKRTLVSTG